MNTQMEEKQSLDANLVNAVVKATMSVLETMAQTKVTFKEVSACEDYRASGDISAVISIMGSDGEGMFAVSLSLEVASLLVSRLLGIQPERLSSDDRSDGVGELVNMISGNAKAILSQGTDTVYKLSLPTVILGKDHEISSRPKGTPYLVLKFETEGRSFNLQVSFKKRRV